MAQELIPAKLMRYGKQLDVHQTRPKFTRCYEEARVVAKVHIPLGRKDIFHAGSRTAMQSSLGYANAPKVSLVVVLPDSDRG